MANHDDLIRAAQDPGPVIDPLRIAVLNPTQAPRYREMRDRYRVPVWSTWIDRAGTEPQQYAACWREMVFELVGAYAAVVILPAEDQECAIEGVLVGIGAALGGGTWVCIVGDHPQLMTTGAADAFMSHRNVTKFATVQDAMRSIRQRYESDCDLIRRAHRP